MSLKEKLSSLIKKEEVDIRDLIVDNNVSSKYTDAYYNLALNLKYIFSHKECKSLMITSVSDKAGKSIVAINVAITLANMDKKVLLLDLDFYNQCVSERLGIESNKGMMDIICEEFEYNDVVQKTELKNLDIISSSNKISMPQKIFMSQKFAPAIKDLQESYDYDWIIVDSPSAKDHVEVPIINDCCDGSILVINNKTDLIKDIESVKSRLGQKLLGVVINKK